ncbi:MAG: glucose-6-phosphate dehydrogenase [Lactovum sp.]
MEKQVLFTIFGATGDLASRKLYPSLFRLFKRGELAEHFVVIGTARRLWTDDYYREVVCQAISDLAINKRQAVDFASHFYYQSHDVADSENYKSLKNLAEKLGKDYQTQNNQVFFLAMAPQFFASIAEHLKSENILTGKGFERIVIEKPFGESLETARELNDSLISVFDESQIFRIDHYLGKKMIQDVSAIRFANPVFEAVWSNQYIENIQITFAESIGVEDRGGYYDNSGALKDMVQNHVLQVLSLLAMEKPEKFESEAIIAEKVKVLKAIRKYQETEVADNFIAAQYIEGHLESKNFIAYKDEPNVKENSKTETFVAGKFLIDNERWEGVPFYVRSGKRLTEKGTRINVVFKKDNSSLFEGEANILTIYIQPTEGFSLSVNGKKEASGFDISPLRLAFRHDAEYLGNSPEAYETLFLDVLNGNSMNFTHWREAERSWELIDVIREAWDKNDQKLPNYAAGTMGPKEAFELLEKSGHHWQWTPDIWYKERGLL